MTSQILTHYSEDPHRRGRSLTVCGELVGRDELASHTPTCPACIAWIHDPRTAEELFGTAAEIRQFGPVVKSRWSDDAA